MTLSPVWTCSNYEVTRENEPSKLQLAADETAEWAVHNNISINATETKEFYISIQKDKMAPPPVTINNNNSIEQVTPATCLGVTLAADLTF